ncbi:SusC/RagA family TonB-linked outer membrane protein [Niabella sp. 22666]|uniref:SusC/RagA family TonB-linked outer membrane protein n=1 Tax=Niabella sp. 22666 TaxID=3453954 RepID=UPI003F870B00
MKKLTRLQKMMSLLTAHILLISFPFTGFGQTKMVSGNLLDATTSRPVTGASVVIKGTSLGTRTGDAGTFTINVGDNAVLLISAIGYRQLEINAGASLENILLTPESKELDQVVVVGYGTQKKTSLTGSVSTVDAKVFANRGPLASPLAALQGQVPGVTVTRNSAQPGRESWNFLVRGNSSVNGGEPLIIIDGLTLPGTNALNTFNPADIENISFLKDAAATSIYGARAAGGVVIITTKRAKTGKPVIDYNGSVSRKIIGLQPKLVDINGWGPMMEEARVADGFTNADLWYKYAMLAQYATSNGITVMTRPEAAQALANLGLEQAGFFTDVRDFVFFPGTMQDFMFGNATSNEHQLSISGKNEKSGYRISLGFLDDGSLLKVGNNSNKRYNIRLTHDYNFSSRLNLQSNISLEKSDIIQPSNIGAVMNNGIQPGMPSNGLGSTGKPYVWGSGIANASTVAIANFGGDNKELNTAINTSFNLTYTFNKHLKAVGTAGYYYKVTDYKTLENVINWYDYAGASNVSNLSPSGQGRSFYQRSNAKDAYYNLSSYLEYSRKFNTDHELKVMAGTQYDRQEYNRFLGRTLDIVPGVPPSLSNSFGDPASKSVAEAQYHSALAGYFGRLNYTYLNKYLFEANARYDGTSRFIEDDRWKFFYGFSGGWRISEEAFMKNIRIINGLKLRASWGNVGNQGGISLYEYIQLLNLSFSAGAGQSGFPILGTSPSVRIAPGGLVALDRTWERVTTSNLALDFALLNNRLSGTAELFQKNNSNMLIARTYPAVLGVNAPAGNNGKLETRGWEISLNWRDRAGALSYHIGGNISSYKTMLSDFGGQKIIGSGNRGLNNAVEGYPIGSYFGLVYNGRIQTEEQLAAYRAFITGNNINMPAGPANSQANNRLSLGDNMFKDVNGDGKITFPEDAVFLGTDDPRFAYSFNAGLDWKGFDLNMIFQGVGKRTIVRDGSWRVPAGTIFQAQNAAYVNQWWTPERTESWLPRISSTGTINNYNYFPSDWVAENGAYLRLKNLVLGYTLPATLTQKASLQKVRVYLAGNDLWETSKIRDGWDPEASRNVANSGDGSNNGVSTFSARYPFYRYLTFGLNLTF